MKEENLYRVLEKFSTIGELHYFADSQGCTIFDAEDALIWAEIANEINPNSQIYIVTHKPEIYKPEDYSMLLMAKPLVALMHDFLSL